MSRALPVSSVILCTFINGHILHDLSGRWEGTGFNLIAVPAHGSGFDLKLAYYNETLTFSGVHKNVRNAGKHGDLFLSTASYLQEITEFGTGTELHVEPGLFTYQPNFGDDGEKIWRQGCIPHGDSFLAGSDNIIDVTGNNSDFPAESPMPTPGPFQLGYTDPYLNPSIPLGLPEKYGRNIFSNPVHFLNVDKQGQEFESMNVITMSTNPSPAGILNIPFVVKEANAVSMKATFWLERVKTGDGSFWQLQYMQNVILDFPSQDGGKMISWPHISVATLRKVSHAPLVRAPRTVHPTHRNGKKTLVHFLTEGVDAGNLEEALQTVLEFEFSTIPLYLVGFYSLADKSSDLAQRLQSIAVEEMGHFAIVGNIMRSLGFTPDVLSVGFFPNFPTTELPGGIKTTSPIQPDALTLRQIELLAEVEDPEFLPVGDSHELASLQTIGKVYEKILAALPQDPSAWSSNNGSITYDGFGISIGSFEDARKGIEIILHQGEGTPGNPKNDAGELAHYYFFEEIIRGKKLVPSSDPSHPWEYAGAVIQPPALLQPTLKMKDAFDPDFSKILSGFMNNIHQTWNCGNNQFPGGMEDLGESLSGLVAKGIRVKWVLQAPEAATPVAGDSATSDACVGGQ